MWEVEAHVTGPSADDLDQKRQRSTDRAEEHPSRGPKRLARQDSGEQERRERPEECADRPFSARQPKENQESADERPLSDERSDKPTARFPRVRGALKDQVIGRHESTIRSLTAPGNVQISIHCSPFRVGCSLGFAHLLLRLGSTSHARSIPVALGRRAAQRRQRLRRARSRRHRSPDRRRDPRRRG